MLGSHEKDRKFIWIGVGLLICIIGSHLFAAITRYDSWPVSTYSMFSHPESIETTWQYGIIGIDSEGRDVRIPLGSSKWHSVILQEAHKENNLKTLEKSLADFYLKAVKEQKVANNIKYLQLVTFQAKRSSGEPLKVKYKVNHKFKL